QLSEAVNLMEKGAFLRPKYAENMEKFIGEEVAAVSKAIESEDWDGFDTAFAAMVDAANAYHEVYDKAFLRWKVPSEPPPALRCAARGNAPPARCGVEGQRGPPPIPPYPQQTTPAVLRPARPARA